MNHFYWIGDLSWRTWRTSSKPSQHMVWSLMISSKPTTCLRMATWRRSRQRSSPSLAWWVLNHLKFVLWVRFLCCLIGWIWILVCHLFLKRGGEKTSTLFFFCQAKTKGCQSRVDIGVKYADKQERMFNEEKMKAGQCVIGLQVDFFFFLLHRHESASVESTWQIFM